MIEMNKVIYGKALTSKQSAEKALPKSGTWRLKVYNYIHSMGFYGATDQEIQDYFGKSGDTIRPSRKTLQQDGYIMDSGRTRANAAGNQCIVWIVQEFEGRLL